MYFQANYRSIDSKSRIEFSKLQQTACFGRSSFAASLGVSLILKRSRSRSRNTNSHCAALRATYSSGRLSPPRRFEDAIVYQIYPLGTPAAKEGQV